jgi:hypothetical protein
MESHQENSAIISVIVVAALSLAAGCSQSPPPRSAANAGVTPGVMQPINASYYTGADPDHQRGSRSGGGP